MVRAVTSLTLTQAVAEHLRHLIHRGEVGPGDRLPAERELAEQLGVARISLREALKILQDDGYVQVRRGAQGGTYVTELRQPVERWRARMKTQSGEFDDIIDFRIALETDAARLAAGRRDRSDLAGLRAAIKKLGQVDGRAAFRLTDSQFHGGLARAARNVRLENAIQSARGELFSPHDLLPFVDPVEESVRDHQQIYEAVRDGDPDAAATAMREHIERTRRQLREIVFGAQSAANRTTG
ncbi:FadR/GntR family transcriptional regulator [Pseudonocardia sp. H11422]|uniref:FadR/GntR family transcriptional regulator n=1 Tax=Pseudonocardia sp. H11422 TaxID=2835866 RepID=UPI001BDC8942|nr:FadR/GntR family transcriptional regulator [Pseudonocardia sp. H11422]